MCLWTWSHFPVQCSTTSRGKTTNTWVEGGDRVQRPDFKKHWRAMWHPGNPSSLRPMGGKLLPHQLPDQTASQVIIMIKLMKPFNKSTFFSNLIQYYGRNGTSGWGVVPDNRWISLLFNFCWFILRPIYYIHIITLFFRVGITEGTKVKAMKPFKEGDLPEGLIGYVSVEDGNGVELFEKSQDRWEYSQLLTSFHAFFFHQGQFWLE